MMKAMVPEKTVYMALVALLVFSVFTERYAMGKDLSDNGTLPSYLDINIQAMCPDTEGLPKDTKSVPAFSHERHIKEYLKGNATFSTHPYKDDFVCAACHPGSETRQELVTGNRCEGLLKALEDEGGPKGMKKHFHQTCRGCHKNMAKAGKATGPVKCNGCHAKTKK